MALIVRAEWGVDLLLDGHLDGWSPRFVVGHQQHLFYGPGYTWVVGIMRALTFGALSTTGAVKVVGIVSFAALAPAVMFLGRGLGLGRRAAAAAGIFALGVNSVFGIGLSAMYVIGLLPHQLAAVLFCLALGSAARTLVDARRRWVLLTAVAGAAVAVTHPLTLVLLVVFSAVVLPWAFVTTRPSRRGVVRLLAAAAAAVGLAAFWLVPAVVHREYRGFQSAWSLPSLGTRIGEVLDGKILFTAGLAGLVVVGMAFGVVRVSRRRPWAVAPVLAPVAFLIGAHTLARWEPSSVLSQLGNRGLGAAGLVAVLPLGALVARLVRRAGQVRPLRNAGGERRRTLGDVATMAAASVVLLVFSSNLRHIPKEMGDPAPELVTAARVLREAVPAHARFATERDFPAEIGRLGMSHPDFWLAQRSRRNTLNLFGIELSKSAATEAAVGAMRDREPDELAAALSRVGVSHLVTVRPESTDRLLASPRFTPLYRGPSLAVLAVTGRDGQPPPSTLLESPTTSVSARLRVDAVDRFTWDLEIPMAAPVTIALGEAPRWRAEVNGERATLATTDDKILLVNLPEGRSRLRIWYAPDPWSAVGVTITLVTAAAMAVAAVVSRRRRQGTNGG